MLNSLSEISSVEESAQHPNYHSCMRGLVRVECKDGTVVWTKPEYAERVRDLVVPKATPEEIAFYAQAQDNYWKGHQQK
jgi:hypothetical protein